MRGAAALDATGGDFILRARAVVAGGLSSSYSLPSTTVSLPFTHHLSHSRSLLVQFRQLRTSLVASTEERVAVEAMTRHALGGGGPGGVATPVGEARPLGGDVDALDASVRRVHALLDSVCAYVDDVVEGRRPGDEATGRAIAEALAAVPRGVGDAAAAAGGLDGTSPAARATQDVLMVSYLASLAQRQIELAERVSQMTPAVRVPPPA